MSTQRNIVKPAPGSTILALNILAYNQYRYFGIFIVEINGRCRKRLDFQPFFDVLL